MKLSNYIKNIFLVLFFNIILVLDVLGDNPDNIDNNPDDIYFTPNEEEITAGLLLPHLPVEETEFTNETATTRNVGFGCIIRVNDIYDPKSEANLIFDDRHINRNEKFYLKNLNTITEPLPNRLLVQNVKFPDNISVTVPLEYDQPIKCDSGFWALDVKISSISSGRNPNLSFGEDPDDVDDYDETSVQNRMYRFKRQWVTFEFLNKNQPQLILPPNILLKILNPELYIYDNSQLLDFTGKLICTAQNQDLIFVPTAIYDTKKIRIENQSYKCIVRDQFHRKIADSLNYNVRYILEFKNKSLNENHGFLCINSIQNAENMAKMANIINSKITCNLSRDQNNSKLLLLSCRQQSIDKFSSLSRRKQFMAFLSRTFNSSKWIKNWGADNIHQIDTGVYGILETYD